MSDLPRRDPRAEWIRRNRLHPRHIEFATPSGQVLGPSGLVRKNVHAVGFIGPNGVKRIERGAVAQGGAGPSGQSTRERAEPLVANPLPLHRVENPEFYVAVVPDLIGARLSDHDRDVFGQARRLIQEATGQGAVIAIALGDARDAQFDTAGADRLIHITELQEQPLAGYCPELKLAVLEAVEGELRPRYWLFPDSVHGGADLGSRLSARLHERPAVHAWEVKDGEAVCRGGGQLTDWRRPLPRVLLLGEECALPVSETRHEAMPLSLSEISPVTPLIEDLGPVEVDANGIALEEAEFILAAGNGVRDWNQFHALAAALGATEGASRVAVDDGHMPRFRQVGATGTYVTARVYMAVGISGAVQHLQGINRCEKVLAINLDAGCDMVKRADLSVIGDSEHILGELLAMAKLRRRARAAEDKENRDVA